MISIIKPAYNRTVGSTCGNDMLLYNNIIEHIKVYLGVCGVQSFKDSNVFIKQKTKEQFSKYNKFERVSSDNIVPEIVTPERYVDAMLDLLPSDVWNDKTVFLDPACKKGEFLRAIYDRLMAAPALVRRYPNITNRALHILSRQVFGVAISEESRQLTINLLSDGAFDLNIKCIEKSGYIKALKAGKIKEIFKEAFGKDMNIDVVIGNPPYNDTDSTGSSIPLYAIFINNVILLNPGYVVMITPSRWFIGADKHNRECRRNLLNKLQYIVDYSDASSLFSNVSIAGGVSYFLYNSDYNGVPMYTIDNEQSTMICTGDYFVRGKAANILFNHIRVNKNQEYFNRPWISTAFYGLTRNAIGVPNSDNTHTIKLISSKGISWLSKEDIKCSTVIVDTCLQYNNMDKINSYKVAIAYSSMELNRIMILEPNEVCTLTYLVVGVFKSRDEAENCIKYLKTKFVNILFKALKVKLGTTKENLALIPLQDFTNSNRTIDWSQSIDKIDKQLYAKYKLTQNEINVIESTIKEMR